MNEEKYENKKEPNISYSEESEESDINSSYNKINAVKSFWKEELKKLSNPFNYEEVRNHLNNPKYWFKIPDEILTFEGYIKLLAYLQNLRTEILKVSILIDEHAAYKRAALKNMKEIFPGLFNKKECPTDKIREARASNELMVFTSIVEQANILQKISYSILNNIDSAIAQVNRQMKSVDMGIKTSSITTTDARDWNDYNDDYNDDYDDNNDIDYDEK